MLETFSTAFRSEEDSGWQHPTVGTSTRSSTSFRPAKEKVIKGRILQWLMNYVNGYLSRSLQHGGGVRHARLISMKAWNSGSPISLAFTAMVIGKELPDVGCTDRRIAMKDFNGELLSETA